MQLAQALEVAIEMVPREAGPEQVLAGLAAQSSKAQHLDAIVLDADERGLENAVEWVRTFHGEYLRRQAVAAAEAWENAFRPRPSQEPPSPPVPPVLIVLASPDRLNQGLGDVEARLAGGGAVVYEKPSDPGWLANIADRLHEELTETYARFWAAEQRTGEWQEPEAVHGPEGQPDLAPYIAPLYQLSDEDFEALLERGRGADPLATGE